MEQYPEIYQEEESIDLKKYLFRILYNWWWFALSVFIAVTIAYLVNRYSEETYQAGCSIIIANEATTARNDVATIIEEMTNLRTRQTRAIVQNEITVLKSYKMARMTVEELDFGITYTAVGRRGIAESKMYNLSPFIVIPDTAKPNVNNYKINVTVLSPTKYRIDIDDRYKISEELYFGQKFEHGSFNFTIVPRTPESIVNLPDFPKKYYFEINTPNGLANRYRGMLNVEVNDDRGSILTLTLSGPNREQICDYLNKLSEVYIQYNLDEKNAASFNTIQFIDDQLRDIVDSLEIAGNQLQNFRTANRVIDISREGNILFDQIETLNTEKAGYDIQSRYFRYIKDYIESRKESSDIIAPSVMGISDALLNSLVAQINDLNMQRRTLEFSTVEGNPATNLVEMQLADAKQALLENVNNLIETNSISLANLEERIARVEAEIQKLPATERQLINIERDFNINDQIYTFLLEKRAEAGITKASNTPDHRQLDIARPENTAMTRPKTSMNYMMALVIGGLLPLMLIILIEYFNNKIVDRKDIESRTDIPILGSVGHNDKAYNIPVFEAPKSSLAESFRALRTNLQYMLKDDNRKVISISS
ncbi:MAG: hypothetical protein JXB19_08170, partial [Bacteroidales bacterium]|nr:hypothetical protein [Bacteroidales bacterium]